jgi:hypothetical protein
MACKSGKRLRRGLARSVTVHRLQKKKAKEQAKLNSVSVQKDSRLSAVYFYFFVNKKFG